MSDAELKPIFLAFCDATKKGATGATDKTFKKICQDAKLLGKNFNATEMDIKYRKVLGNKSKELDFNGFLKVLEEVAPAASKDMGCDAPGSVQKMKEKIVACGGPGKTGATAASGDAATKRLTDAKGYTGAHKERFDESGKGKGIEGREDRDAHAASGYVGGYKGAGQYDTKH